MLNKSINFAPSAPDSLHCASFQLPVIEALTELGIMDIVFPGPTFFGNADEDQFFGWIYSLPGYLEVKGESRGLRLSLNDPVDEESIRQLLVLFKRWNIDIEPLGVLKNSENENFVLWKSGV